MTATVAGIHLGPDIHANRPAANTVPDASLYSCTTHGLIYKSSYGGNSWSTWATLGAAASGSITASGYTQSTAKMLGRSTASTGAIEEITVGSGLSLSAGTLSASGGGGSLTTDSIALSGSTVSVTSGADATILARTLAAGTWLLLAQITIQAASPGADYYLWIDDGSGIVGSGQTTIGGNLWAASIPIVCLVTPSGSTTYTIKGRSSGATGTAQISTPNGTKGKASNFVCVKVA